MEDSFAGKGIGGYCCVQISIEEILFRSVQSFICIRRLVKRNCNCQNHLTIYFECSLPIACRRLRLLGTCNPAHCCPLSSSMFAASGMRRNLSPFMLHILQKVANERSTKTVHDEASSEILLLDSLTFFASSCNRVCESGDTKESKRAFWCGKYTIK